MPTKPWCCTRISSPPGPFFWMRITLPGAVATIDPPGGAGRSAPWWRVPSWGWLASTRGPNGEEMHAGFTGGTSIGLGCGSAFAPPALGIKARTAPATNNRPTICSDECDWQVGRRVRSVFLVTLIPCFFNQAVCSACALVSAAVLGRLSRLAFWRRHLDYARHSLGSRRMRWQALLNSGADVVLYGHQDAAMSGFRNVATLLNYRI